MRIFVTGASGYIGSALVRAFAQAGHEVGGLVRSRDKEAHVRSLGGVPIFGRLEDPELYQHFAAESAVAIHAAAPDPERDRQVCETLISAMKAEGEDKTFILTTGCLVLGDTGDAPVDEKGSTERPFPLVAWRVPLERYVLDQSTQAFSTSVIRPAWVYGGKGGGVLGQYAKSAAEPGGVAYIGGGQNKMAYVHIDDLAQLYLKVAEKRARGIFHGVDDSNLTNAELAQAVAKAAGKPGKVRGISLADAQAHSGPFAAAFGVNQRLKTSRATEVGWSPQHRDIRHAIDAALKP